MKNYSHKTNKQQTRYRTPSTFRFQTKFKMITKHYYANRKKTTA